MVTCVSVLGCFLICLAWYVCAAVLFWVDTGFCWFLLLAWLIDDWTWGWLYFTWFMFCIVCGFAMRLCYMFLMFLGCFTRFVLTIVILFDVVLIGFDSLCFELTSIVFCVLFCCSCLLGWRLWLDCLFMCFLVCCNAVGLVDWLIIGLTDFVLPCWLLWVLLFAWILLLVYCFAFDDDDLITGVCVLILVFCLEFVLFCLFCVTYVGCVLMV